MLSRILDAFREAPTAPRVTDPEARDALYRRSRNHVLYGSMVGYGLFYVCRKNFGVAQTQLAADLGYSNAELGDLGARLYVAYAMSKLLMGLVADRCHPRTMLVSGLVLAAGSNALFGLSSSLTLLGALWFANGVFQAAGAPASAKILAVWFSASERGTKTAIWNVSHQAGGGIAVQLAGLYAATWGWRGAFLGPALIAVAGAVLVAAFLHDRPESRGLPPIEEHRNDPAPADDDVALWPLLRDRILLNPWSWVVALASCCTYVARVGAIDWMPKFLVERHGLGIGSASSITSLLEYAGIPGVFLCGWLSDRVFHGRRGPVVLVSLLLLAASTWAVQRVPADSPNLRTLGVAAIGFFTYGPQCLLAGVAPVDQSSKRVAAAAIGFTGFVSYLGAIAASSITGRLLGPSKDWESAFAFWALAALAGAVVCIPLWWRRPGGAPLRVKS